MEDAMPLRLSVAVLGLCVTQWISKTVWIPGAQAEETFRRVRVGLYLEGTSTEMSEQRESPGSGRLGPRDLGGREERLASASRAATFITSTIYALSCAQAAVERKINTAYWGSAV
ncbi:hypothetical protein AAFF_G00408100 [Aldrovandia affinis]|uniref:Uncharacterized protein n=1 Tax=Aldrovandia affinis TaxID=143900 RepID=A0AAD7WK67_9TELE|nr:hypothetical protein AAFF_G00408100 [Aldrovandia affinis]